MEKKRGDVKTAAATCLLSARASPPVHLCRGACVMVNTCGWAAKAGHEKRSKWAGLPPLKKDGKNTV